MKLRRQGRAGLRNNTQGCREREWQCHFRERGRAIVPPRAH